MVSQRYGYPTEEELLATRLCPICHAPTIISELYQTYDCQGIPYRRVCAECYEDIEERGYDGVAYTSADECIDDNY